MLTETLADRHGEWVEFSALSDKELARRLTQLTKQKHALDAELLLCLAELDRRKLYREHACPSLFDFCVRRLGFSEDVAYKRVGAARLVRRFPFVHALLADGSLHLTGLMLLAPHLTEENHREWLLAATEKSKREIEKLVATRCPKPDVPSCVRKLPEPRGHSASPAVEPPIPAAIPSSLAPSLSPASGALASLAVVTRPSSARSTTTPLSESTYRVVFTASESLKQKLDRARELASHAVSPSDLPGLIERAIDLLVASEERRRCIGHKQDPDLADGRPDFPRASEHSESSRHVPATERRLVWKRDGAQCTYVDEEGHRCPCRHFLQLDHIVPYALGGPHIAPNLRLRCATHNRHWAEEIFGHAKIEAAIGHARSDR